jgi:putative intracellular protease/amidase
MPLVEKGSPAATGEKKKRVAVLVFDGAEIIDFTGPWEVFGAVDFQVYAVAATHDPITTSMGMKLVPTYAFADAPRPDVLLVPGGAVEGARSNPATLKWVVETSASAEETLSVCNGAFILASAGLLDGLSATTTFHLIPKLREQFPKIKVVSDRRFVDNGKIVTAAGLSSGIDGALHVVEKMLGKGNAEHAALGIEYDWHPDGTFVRAELADHVIPAVDLKSAGTWTWDKTEGTTDQWETVVRGTSPKSAPELSGLIGAALAKAGWQRGTSTPTSSEWTFRDDLGARWTGAHAVVPPSAPREEYVVRVNVARVSRSAPSP